MVGLKGCHSCFLLRAALEIQGRMGIDEKRLNGWPIVFIGPHMLLFFYSF